MLLLASYSITQMLVATARKLWESPPPPPRFPPQFSVCLIHCCGNALSHGFWLR